MRDRMIELSNSRTSLNGWTWRTILQSETVDYNEGLTEKEVFVKLDTTLNDVLRKQDEFLKKMKLSDNLLQQIETVRNSEQ